MKHPKTLFSTLPLVLFVLLFVFIIIYSTNRASFLSGGVDLSIETITDGQVLYESALVVQGSAKRARHIALNGREIVINEAGRFSETILVTPGPNIILIQVEDKFGEFEEKRLSVWYDNDKDSTEELIARWKNISPPQEELIGEEGGNESNEDEQVPLEQETPIEDTLHI